VNTVDQDAIPPQGSAPDWTIDQNWASYSAQEHTRWTALYERQMEILPGRACDAFMQGLDRLDLHGAGIPDFKRLNEGLSALTGWTIVAVPGLVPDAVFFDHLANRRFPAGNFIRRQDQFDYISEPDVFHDVFGHVPLLADPVFGDYMQAYGIGGLRALGLHSLDTLARLYWYTVEFGLLPHHRDPASMVQASCPRPARANMPWNLPSPSAWTLTSPVSCARSTKSTISKRPTSRSTALSNCSTLPSKTLGRSMKA
jgi:phenylalanine-4-hydroxylase